MTGFIGWLLAFFRQKPQANMSKEVIITIHGVNPDREWQKRVGRVLVPHFDCKTFNYHGYDTILGPVRAIANIETFLVIFGISCVLIWKYVGNWIFATFLLLAAFILSVAVSVVAASLGRKRYANIIKQQIDAASRAYKRPHIVAHSLGTYLVGSVLEKFHDIHLGNVVLVSSVLPSTYPWMRLLEARPECVLNVRNELGTADKVTKLVAKIQWLVPDLGASGVHGFAGGPTVVHTSNNPLAGCDQCADTPVQVHNVLLQQYGHSTEFLGDGHARKLWLPFLWGFNPDEFFRFLEMCQAAARFQQDYRYNEVEELVTQLGNSSFTWTNNRPVVDYVKDVVRSHLEHKRLPAEPAKVDNLTEAIMDTLHVMVHEACSEVARLDAIDENVARALHPRIAIGKVVETVIRSEQLAA